MLFLLIETVFSIVMKNWVVVFVTLLYSIVEIFDEFINKCMYLSICHYAINIYLFSIAINC